MRNGRLPTGLFSASMVLYYRNCRRGPGVVLNGREEGRGRETGTAYVHGYDHCPARRKGVKLMMLLAKKKSGSNPPILLAIFDQESF